MIFLSIKEKSSTCVEYAVRQPVFVYANTLLQFAMVTLLRRRLQRFLAHQASFSLSRTVGNSAPPCSNATVFVLTYCKYRACGWFHRTAGLFCCLDIHGNQVTTFSSKKFMVAIWRATDDPHCSYWRGLTTKEREKLELLLLSHPLVECFASSETSWNAG